MRDRKSRSASFGFLIEGKITDAKFTLAALPGVTNAEVAYEEGFSGTLDLCSPWVSSRGR